MPLTATGIRFAYRGAPPVLDDLDLRVGHGESVAVMSPSGVGKSTLLAVLGGMRTPAAGEVRLTDGSGDPLGPDEVAWVFQSMQLIRRRSVRDNVALGLLALGAPRWEAEDEAERALELFGMADHAARPVRDLSGGQAQRVALARVAARRPAVLLADEPTANLDRVGADHVATTLRSAFPDAVVVVATHDPVVAARMDRVLELRDGRLWGPT